MTDGAGEEEDGLPTVRKASEGGGNEGRRTLVPSIVSVTSALSDALVENSRLEWAGSLLVRTALDEAIECLSIVGGGEARRRRKHERADRRRGRKMAIQRAGCKKATVHLQSVRVRVLEGLLAGSYLFPVDLRGDGGETSPLRLAVRLARTGSPEATPIRGFTENSTQKVQISAGGQFGSRARLRFLLLLQIINSVPSY